MQIVIGTELEKLVSEKTRPVKRHIYEEYLRSVTAANEHVTVLLGLWRTGKTVMMMQSIEELGIDNCIYLL